jgi:hypothetical protein
MTPRIGFHCHVDHWRDVRVRCHDIRKSSDRAGKQCGAAATLTAKRPFPPHRRQQSLPHTRQPFIPEAPRFSFDHANHTVPQNRSGYRFREKADSEVVPHLCDSRSSLDLGCQRIDQRDIQTFHDPAEFGLAVTALRVLGVDPEYAMTVRVER